MTSLTELKKRVIFQVMDEELGMAIGYCFDKAGKPLRYKFKIGYTNNGKFKINKPQIINRETYAEILSRYGESRSTEITKFKEILSEVDRGVGSKT